MRKWLPVMMKELSKSKRYSTQAQGGNTASAANANAVNNANAAVGGFEGGLGPWLEERVGAQGMRAIGVLGILNYAIFLGQYLLGDR